MKEKKFVVPQWQKEEVGKRLNAINSDPSQLISSKESLHRMNHLKNSVPAWQQNESLKRLEEMKSNPSSVLSKEDFFRALDDMDEDEKI